MAKRIKRVLAVCRPEKLYVNPDCGFGWSPRYMCNGKIRALAAGARLVRQELRRGLRPAPPPPPGIQEASWRPTGTMRAVFYQGAQTFTPGTAPIPTAAAGEALLRVLRVGICGTDLHIFQGHLDNRVPRGGIIGHETFAEVARGAGGDGVRAGDRVVVEPVRSCGTCRACRIGATTSVTT